MTWHRAAPIDPSMHGPAADLKTHPVHYYNRMGKALEESTRSFELAIEMPFQASRRSAPDSGLPQDEAAAEAQGDAFEPVTLRIEYELQGSRHGLRFLCTPSQEDPACLAYFQISYAADVRLNRCWMPCIEAGPEAPRCPWDIEMDVSTEAILPSLVDRLHAVASGVLYRQFSQAGRKLFHFKMDTAIPAGQIAWAVGLFDSTKIPLAPFAHAFCPVGQSARLAPAVEFFNRAFGFLNWYLSTLFPWPSHYLVFVRGLPCDAYHGANVTLLGTHLLGEPAPALIDQVWETRGLLAQALVRQYFGVRLQAGSGEDAWLMAGLQGYAEGLLLRVFHGNNDYKYQLRCDLERALELEALRARPPLQFPSHGRDAESQEWLGLKARVVLVILERTMERTGLQRVLMQIWSEVCDGRLTALTTRHLLKMVRRITGKDVAAWADNWVYGSGAPALTCSFLFNRKRSTIDLDLRQATLHQPGRKFSVSPGPLGVRALRL